MSTQDFDDEARLRRHRQFVLELEHEIRQVNRRIIHERISSLTREDCLSLETQVARARARYLDLALQIAHADQEARPDESTLDALRSARLHFEELRDAFLALERAIECGYLDITLPNS